MKKIALLFLATLFSCTPPEQPTKTERKQKGEKMLILGNSILFHGEAPVLGWYGNWGMAASAENKDFLHLIKQQYPFVNSMNIAVWEQNFQIPTVNTVHYDILVIRLGENVADLTNYKERLQELILAYKSGDTQVIVTGVSWWNQGKDEIHSELCQEEGYTYVSLQGMWGSAYQATQYPNSSVAVHANDLGHQFIANSILNNIQQ